MWNKTFGKIHSIRMQNKMSGKASVTMIDGCFKSGPEQRFGLFTGSTVVRVEHYWPCGLPPGLFRRDNGFYRVRPT